MTASRAKVLVVGPTPPPNFGVATATRGILDSEVLSARFDLLHVNTSDNRGLSNMGRLDATNVALGFRQAWGVLRAGLRERPPVVYLVLSHNRWAFLRDALLVVVARLSGARVVCHLRHSRYADFYDESSPPMRLIIRGTFRLCTRVLVLGENLRAMALHVDPDAVVRVAPNGCDDFAHATVVPSAPRGTWPKVLFLSNLRASKGLMIVLDAARRASEQGIGGEFVFAGEWSSSEEERAAREFVSQNRLDDSVCFLAPVSGSAKTDLLLGSDILVLPSYGEGHPWAIVEAMCAGLAIVATDTGAVSETVEDGVTGFVVPVGAMDAFGDRLILLLQDPSMCGSMARAGRERYERLFTRQRSHELLAEAFDEALEAT